MTDHPKTSGVACPNCGETSSEVKDSRAHFATRIRRRRKCLECGTAFTTFEVSSYEAMLIDVAKTGFQKLQIAMGGMWAVLNHVQNEVDKTEAPSGDEQDAH